MITNLLLVDLKLREYQWRLFLNSPWKWFTPAPMVPLKVWPINMVLNSCCCFFLFFFFFFFWPHHVACEILIPWPAIELVPTAMKAWNFNYWTTKEFPLLLFDKLCLCPHPQTSLTPPTTATHEGLNCGCDSDHSFYCNPGPVITAAWI